MSSTQLGVLFVCTGNRARSQMAETILRHLSEGRVDVASAGTNPKGDIHPMAREAVKRLLDVEMIGQWPKSVDLFVNRRFDYVITVCDVAAETRPVLTGNNEEKQRAFDELAGPMIARIQAWLSSAEVQDRLKREI